MKSEVSTSCRFCEFKVTGEDGNQTGCELNLLHKFQEKGIEVVERENDDEAGKDSSFEPQTFCLFRRPSGWKKAMEEKLEQGKTYHDIAWDELSPKVTLVVFVPPDTTMEEIQTFTNRIHLMTIKPESLLFMNFSSISPREFRKLSSSISWRMEFMMDASHSKDKLRDIGNNLASKKVKTEHFVQMDIDQDIELDYISTLKNKIVDDLERFICIRNEVGKPSFYFKSVYRHLRGNEQAPIDEKIELFAEEQECQNLIKTHKEVFQK